MTQVRREISGAWISVMATAAATAAAPTPEPSSPSESAAATRTSECALVSPEI